MTRLKIIGAAIVAFLAAVGAAFLRGRATGKADAAADAAERREKVQEKFDEIDRSVPDPAASYDRLRKLGR